MSKFKKWFILISFISINANATDLFPLQMLNLTDQDLRISFQEDIGHVFLDCELEDNTLLPKGAYSHTYGVNFAPRDPSYQFKIIFSGEQDCVFTVGYYKPPGEPKVSVSGSGCRQAGYRVEHHTGSDPLVLFMKSN